VAQEVTIREATPDDSAAIGRLWQELMSFHRDFDPRRFCLAPDALHTWDQYLAEHMRDEGRLVLVAEAHGHVVGYALAGVGQDPPVFSTAPHGLVGDFCIAAQWRRRGLGRQLFAGLVSWFRARGLREVRLSAHASNPVSNAFWQAMGFQPYLIRMRRSLETAHDEMA